MSKTKEMIKILFPNTQSNNIDEACMYIGEYGKVFGLSTDLRVAHFLAQVREEVGPELKAISENLNYKPSTLIAMWSKRFDTDGDGKLDEEELEAINKYGITSSHPANQEMLANIVYYDRLGNGSLESGDGWKYRGFGALQITGKYNFKEVQKRIDKYASGSKVDIVNNKSNTSLKDCLFVGFAFWIWKDLYRLADNGKDSKVVDSITSVINKYTHSYKARSSHFSKIANLI